MYLLQALEGNVYLLATIAGVFGLLLGSFFNVVILRFPPMLEYMWTRDCNEHLGLKQTQGKPEGLIWQRSRCPQCKSQIKSWQNIPLISYLLLRGRCAACGKSISLRYPLVEGLTAGLTVLVVLEFGWSWQTVCALLFTWWLIIIAFIDYDTMLIPDQLSLPLIWLGLMVALFGVFVNSSQAIVGALVGYLSLWLVFQLFKLLTGKEGMGYGDFKLLSAAGAWMGAKPLILVVILASFVGAVLGGLTLLFNKNAEKQIPFGPYLAAGAWVTLMWGEQIFTWYLSQF